MAQRHYHFMQSRRHWKSNFGVFLVWSKFCDLRTSQRNDIASRLGLDRGDTSRSDFEVARSIVEDARRKGLLSDLLTSIECEEDFG